MISIVYQMICHTHFCFISVGDWNLNLGKTAYKRSLILRYMNLNPRFKNGNMYEILIIMELIKTPQL